MKLTINGKDPDMLYQDESATEDDREKFGSFLEFSEYWSADVDVDPATGRGTICFRRKD